MRVREEAGNRNYNQKAYNRKRKGNGAEFTFKMRKASYSGKNYIVYAIRRKCYGSRIVREKSKYRSRSGTDN